MKIHFHTTALTAALAVVLTSAAYADQSSRTQSGDAMGASGTSASTSTSAMSFESLDVNKDGYLSRQEIANSQAALDWQQWDKNVDDQLDRSEFSAFEALPQGGETETPAGSGSTGSQQPLDSDQSR